ncbi:hypothetical protein C4K68_01025 [Pokkaliibacter plantistimulans]|uniref:Uncharacterized protein n=1 Tax=Proteobacteria bacterium 228 TaxID=2083153 RepID=A0A2S5KX82_9PROT|nr:hypothetical protein [Pokkaliibacter plantistimulans]PPC79318.1 hypothetical protein C4K68_01025 [Pokkaliibacter plantistimulans]
MSFLVFMLDLWSADGAALTAMDEVSWQQKPIQYASRTVVEITRVTHELNMCMSLQQAVVPHKVPVHLALSTPEKRQLPQGQVWSG